jgi:hypothetical protein
MACDVSSPPPATVTVMDLVSVNVMPDGKLLVHECVGIACVS